MKKNLFVCCFVLFIAIYSQAQNFYEFGKPTAQELALTTYAPDPTAKAVILYEKGSYKFEEEYEHHLTFFKLKETVYRKIKILSEDEKEKHSTVSIFVIGNSLDYERVSQIRAVTTNPNGQTHVSPGQIFTKKHPNNHYEITFTFPNVQKGSILEFEYTVSSSNYFRLSDWYFQHSIPTIYSEFYAEIPGFFTYTRTLLGKHPLWINKADIKKYCFYFNNNKNNAECEVLTYAMQNVPALVEEDFMLSPRNYANRINFELERIIYQNGERKIYARDWKSVEQEFRNDQRIGQQLNNQSYIKNQLPKDILNIADKTERAKAIYRFIQKHFTLSTSFYGLYTENDVKKAFQNKSGNAVEINMALVNALNAADIDTYLSLSATRQKGLPLQDMAVFNDFNYAMAYLKIGDQSYFLDASDKFLDFGMVPMHALNYYARILDFKKGGYWENIMPYPQNSNAVSVQLQVTDNFDFDGKVRENSTGYYAQKKRKVLSEVDRDNYLRLQEGGASLEFEITDYTVTNQEDNSQTLIENYEIIIKSTEADQLIVYPFIIMNGFTKNPFQLDQRSYPIDFGHTQRQTYMLSMNLADKYTIENLPESVTYRLPENVGEIAINYAMNDNTLQMRFNFQINQVHFPADSYEGIKEFFGHLAHIQNSNPVILKRL